MTAKSSARIRRDLKILLVVYSFCLFVATMVTTMSLFRVKDFLANATHVNGRVVALEPGAKGALAPVVRFTTASGETLQLKSFLSTSPAPKVGDSVKVLYRTSNPHDWLIDDWLHLYFWAIVGAMFMFAWTVALTITKVLGDRKGAGK